jgi:predicted RecA/RadA family phage recombinase
MAKNYIQEGDVLTLIAPYTVVSGAGLLVGSIFGVAVTDAASGASVEAGIEGVYELAKASGAWTQGVLLYWDNSAKNVTTSAAAGANKLIGTAAQAQQSGDTVGRVLLNGAFIS